MADGRPIKKVRFESKAGSHREYARQDSNTSRAEKTKAQGVCILTVTPLFSNCTKFT